MRIQGQGYTQLVVQNSHCEIVKSKSGLTHLWNCQKPVHSHTPLGWAAWNEKALWSSVDSSILLEHSNWDGICTWLEYPYMKNEVPFFSGFNEASCDCRTASLGTGWSRCRNADRKAETLPTRTGNMLPSSLFRHATSPRRFCPPQLVRLLRSCSSLTASNTSTRAGSVSENARKPCADELGAA